MKGKLQIIFTGRIWHFHRWANVNCRVNNLFFSWEMVSVAVQSTLYNDKEHGKHWVVIVGDTIVCKFLLPWITYSLSDSSTTLLLGIKFQAWINFWSVWIQMYENMSACVLHQIFKAAFERFVFVKSTFLSCIDFFPPS